MTTWYPAGLLEGAPAKPYGIIVLNQPINAPALNAVVETAVMLVCADAGANRLMQYDGHTGVKKRSPDAIVGDLDSLSNEARQHYANQGVQIPEDPDQYSTDFTKSLRWMRREWDSREGEDSDLDVVVMSGLGGRVDQAFSQIHHMYMVLQQRDLLRGSLYLLSEQSLSFVLAAGQNEMHVNNRAFAENVGIIPVLGLTHITTSGFEWDVSNWATEFGKQVSTSNHIRSDVVKVKVHGSRPLFTLELVKDLCASDPQQQSRAVTEKV
ncbi:thiamine pyrophosphokinase [Exophiala xenobiotica]|uniref:Thiamine pyrophosphokinase n=1 Tax=Lithohypha guttulata TaxID=1690604 RepID=A0ABR0KLC2_9EURO|nr:thiamine pyrophosphokinase [Lithohypha guttulata]KAK5326031.1 thiamine pyrophosphokinase [Exophiala xenobiotica]